MKKIILIAFALTSLGANAQYFQTLYGSTKSPEFLSHGRNTYNAGTGHFMVGPAEYIPAPPFSSQYYAINIQKTDINGSTITPGTFNYQYEMVDLGVMTPTMLTNQENYSIESSTGLGYYIAGSYTNGHPNHPYGVYLFFMDQTGAVHPGPNATVYLPSNKANYSTIRLTSFIESTKNPQNHFLCGYLTEASTGRNKIFVIKVGFAGGILWEHIYDISPNTASTEKPYAIIEAPALHPQHGIDELWVVGEHTDLTTASFNTDAFILRIDDALGNTLNPNMFYGTLNSTDVFTSIIPTANINVDPSGQGSGFVIAGHSTENGHSDAWSIAMDNSHNVVWTKKYNYMINGTPTQNNDICNQIMERINTSGVEEYYLVGTTDNGVKGFDDVLVFKTDNTGTLYPQGQFTYGDLDADRGISIDQLNGFGTDVDGLAIYCQSFHINPTIGGFDHYLIKAYFNGVTACKDDQQDGEEHPGPGYIWYSNSDNSQNIFTTADFLYIRPQFVLDEKVICSASSIIDGDNSRIAPTEPKGDKEAKISPNPIAQGAQYAAIEVEIETPTTAQISVYDMLGRNYYSQTFTLVKGKNNLVLDISNINMAQGMYTVKIQGENLNKNIMLLVK